MPKVHFLSFLLHNFLVTAAMTVEHTRHIAEIFAVDFFKACGCQQPFGCRALCRAAGVSSAEVDKVHSLPCKDKHRLKVSPSRCFFKIKYVSGSTYLKLRHSHNIAALYIVHLIGKGFSAVFCAAQEADLSLPFLILYRCYLKHF